MNPVVNLQTVSLRLGFAGFLASILFYSTATCAGTETLIDDFENAPTFNHWSRYQPEGVTSSLSRGEGHFGSGGNLQFDLGENGSYTTADLALSTPLSGAAISYWAKTPPGVRQRLRVRDSTGQWLEWKISRPMSELDPSRWYRQVVPLSNPFRSWDGANDKVVHFPFDRISLFVGQAFEPGASGVLQFDDFVMLDTLDDLQIRIDPDSQPIAAVLPDSGSLQSRLGVGVHSFTDFGSLEAARNAGIHWVRIDLFRTARESLSGTFGWYNPDRFVQELELLGMRPLFILNDYQVGATRPFPTNSTQIEDFANYAEVCACHFAGHGAIYEAWNEPDFQGYTPSEYAELSAAIIAAVKRGDPASEVVTVAGSGLNPDFARNVLSLGGGEGAASVSVHPYLLQPESLSDEVMNLHDLLADVGFPDLQILDSEWGFSSARYGDGHSPEARHMQAMMVPRAIMADWVSGFQMANYYDLRDDGTNEFGIPGNYGLLDFDRADKPAMQAVRTLSRFATNRIFTGLLPVNAPTLLTALRLDGESNVVIALWPATNVDGLTINVPANSSAVDLLGRPLTLDPASNGLHLTIRQTNSPIYLTVPGQGHATELPLVSTGAVWHYLDIGANLGTSWTGLDFDDSSWTSGAAPLGYGETDLGTTISFGTNANNKFITTYYRKKFVVDHAAAFGELVLRFQRDDGAVVYLNGEEVFTSNLPGAPASDTLALSSVDGTNETHWVKVFVPPSRLREGTNVVAAEVHQVSASNDDLRFDLELSGTQAWIPPTFALLPPQTAFATNAVARLTVDHDGQSPFSYQWWFNGTNALANQTNADLILANAQTSQSGAYQVVVSNQFGSVTSSIASVRIVPTPNVLTNLAELTMALSNGLPILTWPQDAGWLTLLKATHLGASTNWVPATNGCALINGQWTTTLSPAGVQRFFRLTSP